MEPDITIRLFGREIPVVYDTRLPHNLLYIISERTIAAIRDGVVAVQPIDVAFNGIQVAWDGDLPPV